MNGIAQRVCYYPNTMPKTYFALLREAIDNLDIDPIERAADLIRKGKTVYVFGNGGSASTAEHFACDLVKYAGKRAFALTTVPTLTAYANDHWYGRCFADQLEILMQPGDVAFGISCSGSSENVLIALDMATRRGRTILLTSEESLERKVYVQIRVPGDDIRIQEDLHLAVCHAIVGELGEKRS